MHLRVKSSGSRYLLFRRMKQPLAYAVAAAIASLSATAQTKAAPTLPLPAVSRRVTAAPAPAPKAQPAAVVAVDSPRSEESISVGYVMIPFTVLGSQGAPLTDLRSNDVKLYVDDAAVPSDMFEKSMDAPVSYTILVDGSGSMGLAGKMEAARAAVAALLARRKPGDDYALYVFADDEAQEVVPFTDNITTILNAMLRIKPYGKTAFFDAIATMPDRTAAGRNPSRAIILLSDGIDNASHLTRQELARRLEGVAVPIYPLGLREAAEQPKPAPSPAQPNEELSDLQLLDEVARLTGGRLQVGNTPEQLSSAIDALERNLRAQYLIGFSPTGKGAVKYRRISLKLAGRVQSIRVRAGYRGTEPPLTSAATARGKSKRNERKGS
jgi:Ca-activated chloride channel family protein